MAAVRAAFRLSLDRVLSRLVRAEVGAIDIMAVVAEGVVLLVVAEELGVVVAEVVAPKVGVVMAVAMVADINGARAEGPA